MKKALTVLLAAAVACAAAFSRLALSRTPTLQDTIRLEPKDVERIYLLGDHSLQIRNRKQIREIMAYLYDFPIYGKIATSYGPFPPNELDARGPHFLNIVDWNGEHYGFDLSGNVFCARNIYIIGPNNYFTPLFELVDRKPSNTGREYFSYVPNYMQEPFHSWFHNNP